MTVNEQCEVTVCRQQKCHFMDMHGDSLWTWEVTAKGMLHAVRG